MRVLYRNFSVFMVSVSTLDRGLISRCRVDEQLIFQTLLHVELQSLLRESVRLNEQLMGLVLLGFTGVIGFDELNFERFTLKGDDVLYETIQLHDQIHHVLRVLLVGLQLVQLFHVVLVCLAGENFEQATLALVQNRA